MNKNFSSKFKSSTPSLTRMSSGIGIYVQILVVTTLLFVPYFASTCFAQSVERFKIKRESNLCEKAEPFLSAMKSKTDAIEKVLDPSKCITKDLIYVSPSERKVYLGTTSIQYTDGDKLDLAIQKIPEDIKEPFILMNKDGSPPLSTTDKNEGNILTPISLFFGSIGDNWDFRFENKKSNRSLTIDSYVNPYFQAFGGDPLGIPFVYKSGVGMVAGFGTPYSGPMETDHIRGGFHVWAFEFVVTSRIKDFVSKYTSNRAPVETGNAWIGNWNNLYTPHIGFEGSLDIAGFLRLSYFSTIDTLNGIYDPPVVVFNKVTGEPMKNNIVRGGHFGFEFRTPNWIFYRSNAAKMYVAYKFEEWHLGWIAREMKIKNFVFDFRMNATLPGKRDFQLITEMYFDAPLPGFANKAVGIGPSFRFGKTPSNNFGVITAFLNMRIKVGDFFDENLY